MTGQVGIGLDIGASKTLGALVDRDGRVLAQVRQPTITGATGVLETAASVADRLLTSSGVRPDSLWPVGVGVPGLVDVTAGTVKHAVNLGLDGAWVPLRELLAHRLGGPVHLENDVNAAALGAAALVDPVGGSEGVGSGADLAYLSLGTGLAAGLVLDGRLRRGFRGAAGEIGHVPVDPSRERCACGQAGCVEVLASGSRLDRVWPTTDGTPSGQALFAAAMAGDARAVTVRDEFAAAVATAVQLLFLTVDVGQVVVGGGLAQIGEPLRVAVQEQLHRAADSSPFLRSLEMPERVTLVPPAHPVSAVGAALVGLRHGRSAEGAGT